MLDSATATEGAPIDREVHQSTEDSAYSFSVPHDPNPALTRDGENSQSKGQVRPSLDPEVTGAKPLNTVFTPAEQSSTQRPSHHSTYLFVGGAVLALAWAIWSATYRQFAPPEPSAGIYRVRVTVVDDHDIPVEDAVIRVTAANEAKTAANGDGQGNPTLLQSELEFREAEPEFSSEMDFDRSAVSWRRSTTKNGYTRPWVICHLRNSRPI